MTTAWTLTIDCAAPTLLARFWSLALGYTDAPPPAGWDSWRAGQAAFRSRSMTSGPGVSPPTS